LFDLHFEPGNLISASLGLNS